MAIHKSRSRVQFRGRSKQGKTKEKQSLEAAKQKQAKITVENVKAGNISLPKVNEGIYGSGKPTGRAFPCLDTDSDSTYYEDTDDENVAGEAPSFSKQWVPSTEEVALSGHFKSELRVAMSDSCASATKNDTIRPTPPVVGSNRLTLLPTPSMNRKTDKPHMEKYLFPLQSQNSHTRKSFLLSAFRGWSIFLTAQDTKTSCLRPNTCTRASLLWHKISTNL